MPTILPTARSRASSRAVSAAASAIALAVITTGCASNKSTAYSTVGARVAAPAPVPVKIEVEDDGVPVQSPPMRRAATEADDPNEPYSRNYGARRASPPAVKTSVNAASPAATRVGYDSTFDADGIMARAIAAHEARVQ